MAGGGLSSSRRLPVEDSAIAADLDWAREAPGFPARLAETATQNWSIGTASQAAPRPAARRQIRQGGAGRKCATAVCSLITFRNDQVLAPMTAARGTLRIGSKKKKKKRRWRRSHPAALGSWPWRWRPPGLPAARPTDLDRLAAWLAGPDRR